MLEKTVSHEISVKRLEEGLKKGDVKVVFDCPHGEYSLEIDKDEIGLFIPGEKYLGHFLVKGMPDFIGQKNEWKNVCTMNYELKKISKGDYIIYEIID